MSLIASERRNKLISIINTSGSVKVAEVAKLFGVSTETIRKDLRFLSEQGRVQKEFGGAVSLNELIETPLDTRSQENIEAKNRIALRAIECIAGKNVIYIDSGSTLLQLAHMMSIDSNLNDRENMAIVTNSFLSVDRLNKKFKHLYFLGGEVNSSSLSTDGFWAKYALSTLNMDVAFLGTSGFQSHSGPCVKSFADADVKKTVLSNCNLKIVLADSSKFSSNAIIQYADWSDVDMLITDKNAPEDAVAEIKKKTKVELV